MVKAIAGGADPPWPASIMLDGEYGISGVSLSVPVSLGPRGAAVILTTHLEARITAAAALRIDLEAT